MVGIKYINLFILFLFAVFAANGQQVTGLSQWSLFLDPGHSQRENMGLFNYSEAEKVLQVALELRDMLLTQTDIKDVFLARITDDDVISLAARTDLANSLGAQFYYSIHSDAGSPAANSALMLYGGWRSEGQTVEKSPTGGALFGEILNDDLSGAMRIGTRGNWADRSFYLGVVDNHANNWPYLHVNRTTNMASLLSEAGFHTNVRQQQLNMNAQWKRLEALSAFRSFLEYHKIDRPEVGIISGVISDFETGMPINGAVVEIDEVKYVTDTYNSLFYKYSSNANELSNGFYWIEGLTPGSQLEVRFSCEGYEPNNVMLNIASKHNGSTAENITFFDARLVNSTPAKILNVEISSDVEKIVPTAELKLYFSRDMNKSAVQAAFFVNSENISLSFKWFNDKVLVVTLSGLEYQFLYDVKISGSIAKDGVADKFLDGNANGQEGGDFDIAISTIVPFEHKGISISPNPTANVIEVFSEEMIKQVRVYGLTGVMLARFNMNYYYEGKVDLSNLPAGIYLLKIDTDQRSIIRKVVKK